MGNNVMTKVVGLIYVKTKVYIWKDNYLDECMPYFKDEQKSCFWWPFEQGWVQNDICIR